MPKAVCDRSKATNKAAALAKLVAAATGTEINPSGMCMRLVFFKCVFCRLIVSNITTNKINSKLKFISFDNTLLVDVWEFYLGYFCNKKYVESYICFLNR